MPKKILKQFTIGIILSTLAITAGYLISPIEVRFLKTLTPDSVLIGATYAIGSILFALISVWLGRMSDRIGRNRFIIIGAFIGIIYPLLYASTLNVFQYMGVKFAWAFSAASTGPIFMAYMQDLVKDLKEKGHYMSIMFAFQSLGGAIAMVLGGYLSDLYGLRAPYFVMSILFVMTTLIALRELTIEPIKDVRSQSRNKDFLFGIKYIFSKPALVFYFIINSAQSLNFGIKYMLYPLIIFSITKSDASTGLIMGTQGVVAFFVLLFIGKVALKIGTYKFAFITLFMLVLSGTILTQTQFIEVFWIAAGLYALGEAMYGPVQSVLIIDNVESKHRGEILGIDAVFDRVYATLAPFFAGLMLTVWSPQKVLLIFISLFWLTLGGGYTIYSRYIKNQIISKSLK
ncbi:hypothetical protein A3H80_02050 [Candidatus Roizmanbacteria bacterium RIFCSPLOWO2_02_FULL_37_19]|uniref:Major facilitator superfamily (MFS) profile domain-containing protein n=1 Tax=Candidatus Roizmanbacteria bacterium RIFCSPHIGHO2_02_FULL_37_24 TaxID=1802037 RepID=A0A1F7GZG1_9BACT|nr:MAG: hypothetical protein A2862_02635 [Candidatus Roizmanbacteria bacterium RIFCSPHIGHO2_01_FULL_38_41]OGK24517.1 MAG: hypothetical protein A3C24_03130 [Candidatus Roizmanbacteria bacterium RIFCSPHIGHO2_02_FULL_37_24]OGK31971.1 MAG: hypothetical protein A3E10_04470 [Candidatus Roizmanbacteria bacterium RIFCSPHIGHO2_12_FULL_37_23]OGK43772.1 MAG: hypothetical protein A2956_04595 [Candidatus Roizmanbacteria bacterium RIFCSPLOWO2_01_FULL_37_57]OGK54326.1 MAG: hypothetical protein A3H80_02050 [Ca